MNQSRLAAYKGTRDFYPPDKRRLDQLLAALAAVAESYGYEPYDAPLLEPLELYRLKSQSSPEIVDQQLYAFSDKSGRELAIRPEMTPSAARMVARRQTELHYPLRWYSCPRLWRYEQPQRGRLREHWQFNVDIFGEATAAAEFELLCLTATIFQSFGAGPETYRLEINSRPLVLDLLQHCGLQPDQISPSLTLIDRREKDPAGFRRQLEALLTAEQIAAGVPDRLESALTVGLADLPGPVRDGPPARELAQLLDDLETAGLANVRFNPGIVRGFDYYTGIVFEVFDQHPDNNRSLLGGGRYDRLIESVGGQPCPAAGFGLGDATLAHFLDSHGLRPDQPGSIQAAVLLVDLPYSAAQPIIDGWRRAGLNLVVEPGSRRLGKKIAWADKQDIPAVIIFGPDELANGRFKCRQLGSGQETVVATLEVVGHLRRPAPAPPAEE